MSRKQDCSSCRQPTTGVSRLDPERPLCSRCQARPLKTPTLATLARRPGSRPVTHACRICLAPEVQTQVGLRMVSNLAGGICADRDACEERQPPLIPRDDAELSSP